MPGGSSKGFGDVEILFHSRGIKGESNCFCVSTALFEIKFISLWLMKPRAMPSSGRSFTANSFAAYNSNNKCYKIHITASLASGKLTEALQLWR